MVLLKFVKNWDIFVLSLILCIQMVAYQMGKTLTNDFEKSGLRCRSGMLLVFQFIPTGFPQSIKRYLDNPLCIWSNRIHCDLRSHRMRDEVKPVFKYDRCVWFDFGNLSDRAQFKERGRSNFCEGISLLHIGNFNLLIFG